MENIGVISRRNFIRETIGLNHDPFALQVAENEARSPETRDHFYGYFTYPRLSLVKNPHQKLQYNELRAENHQIVYGAPGTGKTTLRMTLEADIRLVLDDSLAVTYIISPSTETHTYEQSLARAIAGDLFIQICEQFNVVRQQPSSAQMEAFRLVARLSGADRRVLDKMKDAKGNRLPFGVARHWVLLGKNPVRYLPYSEPLIHLIGQAQSTALWNNDTDPLEWDGNRMMDKVIGASRVWGYKRILVLTDSIDDFSPEAEEMLRAIRPILSRSSEWEQQKIFFKFFLIDDLQKGIEKFLSEIDLSEKIVSARIVWDKKSLRQLVAQRYREAGSRYTSLIDLAAGEIQAHLEEILYAKAKSPREILRRMDKAIEILAFLEPGKTEIDQDYLNAWKAKLAEGYPQQPVKAVQS